MSDTELREQYESSGLAQIAFNSNGRDFYPETIKELLAWRDAHALQARIKEDERTYERWHSKGGLSMGHYLLDHIAQLKAELERKA